MIPTDLGGYHLPRLISSGSLLSWTPAQTPVLMRVLKDGFQWKMVLTDFSLVLLPCIYVPPLSPNQPWDGRWDDYWWGRCPQRVIVSWWVPVVVTSTAWVVWLLSEQVLGGQVASPVVSARMPWVAQVLWPSGVAIFMRDFFERNGFDVSLSFCHIWRAIVSAHLLHGSDVTPVLQLNLRRYSSILWMNTFCQTYNIV